MCSRRASVRPSIDPTGEAAAEKSWKKRTLALIAELDEKQITADWIYKEFLSTRLKSMLEPGIQQKKMITITKAEDKDDSKEA